MPLSQILREILVCPKCNGPLELHEAQGEVRCLRCRLAYAIEGGIPNMLPGEARPLDSLALKGRRSP